ncbi:MAG: hypothetical protein ACXAE3_08205 [Candidatus Kariarchaeaceae archaeon]
MSDHGGKVIMALFLHSYINIPEKDQKKITLKRGNPFRHTLWAVGMLRASLYKAPAQPKMQIYEMVQDPDFDIEDPSPTEMLIVDSCIQELLREVERVQADSQVRHKEHFIVGFDLQRQLGLLYQKAIDYNVHNPENIYHAIMGASWIDLSGLMALTPGRKTLKPGYVPEEIVSRWGKLEQPELAGNSVADLLEGDLIRLVQYYHEILR